MTTADGRPWWRRDLDDHRQREGRCPLCRTARRCWPWAVAFAASVIESSRP